MNQSGVLSREEPYSFFATPVITTVTGSGAPATYGAAAGTKTVDGIYCKTTGNLVVAGQDYTNPGVNGAPYTNQLQTFTAVPAGTILPISPSLIDSTTTGTYIVLYK